VAHSVPVDSERLAGVSPSIENIAMKNMRHPAVAGLYPPGRRTSASRYGSEFSTGCEHGRATAEGHRPEPVAANAHALPEQDRNAARRVLLMGHSRTLGFRRHRGRLRRSSGQYPYRLRRYRKDSRFAVRQKLG
jgi:hypothetical protein